MSDEPAELPTEDKRKLAILYAYLDLRGLADFNIDSRDGRVSEWREELESLQRCACKSLLDLKKCFPWLPLELTKDTIEQASKVDAEV